MSDPRLSIIPAAAVLDPRLKARDLQVLCLFGRHIDRRGWCTRSQVKMAKEIGCARSTVQGSIDRLVVAGWLMRGDSDHYVVIFPEVEDCVLADDALDELEACDGSELRALVERFDGRCWYCGCEVEPSYAGAANPRSPTRDHVVPRSKGGRDRDNIVLACRACNNRKRSRDIGEYRRLISPMDGPLVVFYGEGPK